MSEPKSLLDDGELQFSYLDKVLPGNEFYKRYFQPDSDWKKIDRIKEEFIIALKEVFDEK